MRNIQLCMGYLVIVVLILFLIKLCNGSLYVTLCNGSFIFAHYTLACKALLALCVLFTLHSMMSWSANKPNEIIVWEAPIIVLLGLFFMFILVSSNNLLVAFLAIEGLSITLYYILSADVKKGNTPASMLAYFILGATASLLFLYGVFRIYLQTGTFNYTEIKCFFAEVNSFDIGANSSGYTITLSCLLVGLLFKLAAFPNYFWIRNLYCVASTPVLSYFAIPVKVTLFVIIFKLFTYTFAGLSAIWINLFLYSGLGSLFVGCLLALHARGIHSFIAGAGIHHIGFILCWVSCNTELAFSASIFYLLLYVGTLLAFFSLLAVLKSLHGKFFVTLKDLESAQNNPFIRTILYIIIFSFAGIPPFFAFF
jgi:NADH-quinone oxidoreductase subunit N